MEVRIIRKKGSSASKRRSELSDHRLLEVAESLKLMDTREEGRRLLEDSTDTKDDVVRLARHLDVPFQKSDTTEQIKARVIETTIG